MALNCAGPRRSDGPGRTLLPRKGSDTSTTGCFPAGAACAAPAPLPVAERTALALSLDSYAWTSWYSSISSRIEDNSRSPGSGRSKGGVGSKEMASA